MLSIYWLASKVWFAIANIKKNPMTKAAQPHNLPPNRRAER